MATQTVVSLKWVGSEYNVNPDILSGYKEANSQSFIAGDLVLLSSGTVTEYAADGTALAGIALDDATNVTSGNKEIRILKIRPGDVFEANIASGATAVANVGTKYGLTSPAAGVWAVDTSETTNVIVKVIDIVKSATQAVGDTTGRVKVKFLNNTTTCDLQLA